MPTLRVPRGMVRPKSRPRFGLGRVYSRDQEHEQALAMLWKASGLPKLSGNIAVEIAVPRGTRGDLDNIAKFVLDALRGVAYDDDRLVTELVIRRVPRGDECVISVTEVQNGAEAA